MFEENTFLQPPEIVLMICLHGNVTDMTFKNFVMTFFQIR